MQRFLTTKDIPLTLWTGEKHLCLPRSLRDAYFKTLDEEGLLTRALGRSSSDAIGGKSKKATDDHFVRKFSGSCSRVELAFLDPRNELGDSSDHFVRVFSGGRVSMLDIPCGCGAASLTLLTTVAELRRQHVLPRVPLEVFLTGGDFSCHARTYAGELFDKLQQTLRSQGIFLKLSLYPWDIYDDVSNTSLLSEWLKNHDCEKLFLLRAGFSGVLGDEGKIRKMKGAAGDEAIRCGGYFVSRNSYKNLDRATDKQELISCGTTACFRRSSNV